MKKTYIEPALLITYVEPQKLICTSIQGVSGTGNMETTVSNEETDEYLSRRRRSEWDDEEEEEDW